MLCEYCNKEIKENQSRTMISNDYNLEVNKSYHYCCFLKMKNVFKDIKETLNKNLESKYKFTGGKKND